MVKKTEAPLFKLGDRVKIRSSGMRGPIVEIWGPRPEGMQIYRVRVRRKPTRAYIDVREDQLILLPPKATPPSPQGQG